MFADDTTVYYIGKEVEEIVDALNRILIDFKSWCDQNRFTVHTGKMEAMLICKHACRPYETTDIWQLHIFHLQIYLLGCSNRPQLELETSN